MRKVRKSGVHVRYEYVGYPSSVAKRIAQRLCDEGILEPNLNNIKEALLSLFPDGYDYRLDYEAKSFYNNICEFFSFIEE